MASKSGIGAKLGIAVVVLAALGAGAYWGLRPVAQVAVVSSGRAPNVVPGSVTIFAEGGVLELKSLVSGKVESLDSFKPGHPVKEGELLVQLDASDLKADIEYTEKDLETAKQKQAIGTTTKKELAAAEAAFAYEVERRKNGVGVSDVVFATNERNLDALRKKYELEVLGDRLVIEGFERSLKVKRAELEKMSIRAPAEMVVTEVKTLKGAVIGPSTVLGTLIKTTRTIEAKIAEENFKGVVVGLPVNVRLAGEGNFLFHGKVTQVLPTADAETQRHTVYLELNDITLDKLVPGGTGDVSITLDERDAKAIVPRRALQGDYVYVVEDGRVHRRHIKKGYTSQTYIEILDPDKPGPGEGLRAGEQVIVENLDQFREDDRVRVEVVESAPKA